MRDILFRGKRIDSGDWVYGYFVKSDGPINCGKCYILPTMADFSCGDNGNRIRIGCFVEVDPGTVGQYTRRTDRTGKQIFEGDIARLKHFGNRYVGKIVYNQKTAWFEFWWNIVVGVYGEKATQCANLCVCEDIEVIGNIYDNTELIEEV